MNILVTGGAGFVGSCLAISFKRDSANGCRVIALDNLKRRGSELNLPRLKQGGIEFIHGDIRFLDDLEGIGKIDLIIECSAEPSVLAGYNESPRYVIDTNLGGTINCLELARLNGADIIFLSSSRVYPYEPINRLRYEESATRFELGEGQKERGISPKGFSEGMSLEGARTLYGATKLASELILREYIHMYGIRGVINRCGVIAGPWQMGKVDQGFISLWVARHIFKGKLSYIGFGGEGKQVRDIFHVDDLYRLVKMEVDNLGEHNGEVYNAGGGRENSLSLMELTNLCQEVTGNQIVIDKVKENREGDIPLYITDNSKVTNKTGWIPKRDISSIVNDVAKWINDNRSLLEGVLA